MRWGPNAEHLERTAEQRAEQGLSTESWDNRPQLNEGLLPVWDAWMRLNAQRRTGDGYNPHPLAYADVEAFFRLHGYTDARLIQDWTRWLFACDRAWLRTVAEMNDAKRR